MQKGRQTDRHTHTRRDATENNTRSAQHFCAEYHQYDSLQAAPWYQHNAELGNMNKAIDDMDAAV